MYLDTWTEILQNLASMSQITSVPWRVRLLKHPTGAAGQCISFEDIGGHWMPGIYQCQRASYAHSAHCRSQVIQSSAQFTYLTVFKLCKIVLLWIYSVTGLQKCRAPQFLRGISRLVHAEMVAQYSWYCWRNTFVHPGIYFASMISKHGCCVDWGPHIMDMSRVAQKQHTPWLDEWYSWGGGE